MHQATTLDGKALAAALLPAQQARASQLTAALSRPPGLGVLLVGEDPASEVYVRHKVRRAAAVGLHSEVVRLPASCSQAALQEALESLNRAAHLDALLLQLPLPAGLDAGWALSQIAPEKDVDGLHPTNLGRLLAGLPGPQPCTPRAIMHLLQATGRPLRGAHAVVVGRSPIVGRPLAALLLQHDLTVSLGHSHSVGLAALARQADVLVVAAGVAGLVDASWIKVGATVIDVGINRRDKKLVGDVQFTAAQGRADFISPVPGGVGPLTVAMLVDNALQLAARRAVAP
jgi:methylenetetrahydrofolate dehydrogenase (NADP+)/methenyltetrahydrofolate cyclohydrolase